MILSLVTYNAVNLLAIISIQTILLVNGYDKVALQFFNSQQVQYAQGYDDSIHYAIPPKTILHFSKDVPRCNFNYIPYDSVFPGIPKVALSLTFLDYQHGEGSGLLTETEDVTQTGFTMKTTALTDNSVFGVYISWFAFYDPQVSVQYYETGNFKFMKEAPERDPQRRNDGLGQHNDLLKADIFIEYENKFWEINGKIPRVVTFLNGFKFQGQSSEVKIKVETIQTNGIYLRVNTRHHLRYIRICIIYADENILYKQSESFSAQSSTPFISATKDKKIVQLSNPVNQPEFTNLQESMRLFYGINGFYTDYQHNSRIFIEDVIFSGKEVKITLGTWYDTRCFSISFELFILKPDLNQKVFRETCAEVFSECEFEGTNIQICTEIKSFRALGFAAPIKSIYVPKGMVLKVYYERGSTIIDSANLNLTDDIILPNDQDEPCEHTGEEVLFRQTINCISNVQTEKQPRVHLRNQYLNRDFDKDK